MRVITLRVAEKEVLLFNTEIHYEAPWWQTSLRSIPQTPSCSFEHSVISVISNCVRLTDWGGKTYSADTSIPAVSTWVTLPVCAASRRQEAEFFLITLLLGIVETFGTKGAPLECQGLIRLQVGSLIEVAITFPSLSNRWSVSSPYLWNLAYFRTSNHQFLNYKELWMIGFLVELFSQVGFLSV